MTNGHTHQSPQRLRSGTRAVRLARSAAVIPGIGAGTQERAQGTVEYALVLLGAAALALLLVSWVTGTDVVGRLFDAVFSRILSRAG